MYEEVNSKLEERFVISEFPLNIGIDVTSHCNLNCRMCIRDKMTREKGFMSMTLYKKIIDEIAQENKGTRIWLDAYGEPLLAGWKLYYMIDYAKKKGLYNVCMNTNGTLLKKEYADMLLDSGIDFISLDCDGFSKEVYEKIRINGDRDVFYQNAEYLLEEKKRRNSNAIINFTVIEMEENRHEVEQILEYWRERGAWTTVRRLTSWGGSLSEGKRKPVERIACGNVIGTCVIAWNGKVPRCCVDMDMPHPIGDINESSIKEVWKRNNEGRAAIHMNHQWDLLDEQCKECTDWMLIGERRYNEKGEELTRSYKKEDKIY